MPGARPAGAQGLLLQEAARGGAAGSVGAELRGPEPELKSGSKENVSWGGTGRLWGTPAAGLVLL